MKNFTQKVTQIKKTIVSANRILLHIHPGPDGDSVGSALAFYHVLKQMGKKVEVIGGDSSLPDFLSGLPGFSHIKNQSFFQTNLKRFDCFIILDSSTLEFVSNQEPVKFPSHLTTINIDHHTSNTNFADINLVERNSPATCQILFNLFTKWGISLNKKIAACLLAGIYTDTAFKYSYTNWQTFDIAGKLAKIYPKFPSLFSQIDNSNSPQTLKLAGILLSSVKTYLSGHLAIASVSADKLKRSHLTKSDSKGLDVTNLLKSVSPWHIAVTLFEIEPNLVKASFRTNQPRIYDLAKIASTAGQGGGHPSAAGASFKLSLPATRQKISDTIKKLYPQIDKS
jgi:phosphoesterase RecJ-like protein